MKIKNKGKVYPSPTSASSSSSTSSAAGGGESDVLSVLKLLPAAILALASVLSLEDREVLAYMITRSLKTTTNPSSLVQYPKKKASKKPLSNTHNSNSNSNINSSNQSHRPPVFYCDCFDCYTSYWFRWDSSPNRELIHQAIEAFEEHLNTGEQSWKTTRGKRRDKTSRRAVEKRGFDVPGPPELQPIETPPPEADESFSSSSVVAVVFPDDDVSPAVTPEKASDGVQDEAAAADVDDERVETRILDVVDTEDTAVVARTHAAVSSHKGLARKVLPDVLGLLNSRLWSLWSPNV